MFTDPRCRGEHEVREGLKAGSVGMEGENGRREGR